MCRAPAWLAGVLSVSAASAAAPLRLSYEGRLLRANGEPESGTISLTFKLYEQADASSAAWTEAVVVHLTADGYYAAQLGAVPLPPFDGRDYWLGVTVPDEAEMVPRMKLSSVAYAIRAASAGHADDAARVGGHAGSELFLRSEKLSAAQLSGAVPAANLPLAGSGSAETIARSDHVHSDLESRLTLLDGGGQASWLAYGVTGYAKIYGTIPFGRKFPEIPVVVATIRNPSNNGAYEMRIEEHSRASAMVSLWCGSFVLDVESLSWIAAESGTHALDGATVLTAFGPSSGINPFNVFFSPPFPAGVTPVILITPSEVGSGSGGVTCRMYNVSNTGFTAQCFYNASATEGAVEGVNYIALAPTAPGNPLRINGRTLQAGVADFTAAPAANAMVSFTSPFPAPPSIVLASIYNDSGATSIRVIYPVTESGFRFQTTSCGGAVEPTKKVAWLAIE